MSSLKDIHARFAIKMEQADGRYESDYYSRKGIGDDDEEFRKEVDAAYAWANQRVKSLVFDLIRDTHSEATHPNEFESVLRQKVKDL